MRQTEAFGIPELINLYLPVKGKIEARLAEFRDLLETGSDEELFRELVFCLLTPQSRAKVCWKAVERLGSKCMMEKAEACQIQQKLIGVRFNQRKAAYICLARGMFCQRSLRLTIRGFKSPMEGREWLVANVKGLGYKEASHFLRNIGLGEDLAILDRHILKNINLLGVIEGVPASLGRNAYLKIERDMRDFSDLTKIPMGHLDLLLWYKETGEIFK